MRTPFRYGIFAKLVIGTFLSFFLLFRIEGVSGGACLSNDSTPQLCCSTPDSRFVDTNQIYKVAMDIPGVQPHDLDVSVDNDSRTIKLVGNRRDDEGDVVGCFSKSWQLNDSVDLQSLVMQHDNGVLTVWSPKETSGRTDSPVSKRRDKTKKLPKKAFIRGSAKSTQPQGAITKLKPIITKRLERIEDPLLPEEDPMSVEAIAYDEQELLESVSVLTDEENEFWFHRM